MDHSWEEQGWMFEEAMVIKPAPLLDGCWCIHTCRIYTSTSERLLLRVSRSTRWGDGQQGSVSEEPLPSRRFPDGGHRPTARPKEGSQFIGWMDVLQVTDSPSIGVDGLLDLFPQSGRWTRVRILLSTDLIIIITGRMMG